MLGCFSSAGTGKPHCLEGWSKIASQSKMWLYKASTFMWVGRILTVNTYFCLCQSKNRSYLEPPCGRYCRLIQTMQKSILIPGFNARKSKRVKTFCKAVYDVVKNILVL